MRLLGNGLTALQPADVDRLKSFEGVGRNVRYFLGSDSLLSGEELAQRAFTGPWHFDRDAPRAVVSYRQRGGTPLTGQHAVDVMIAGGVSFGAVCLCVLGPARVDFVAVNDDADMIIGVVFEQR